MGRGCCQCEDADELSVMCKVGIDAADDEKRQRVLKDWRSWLISHCDGDDDSKQQ